MGQTRSALTKLKIHPERVKLQQTAENKLYQSVRCTLTLLNSYLGYLPHSFNTSVYPEALKSAVNEMQSVAEFTERLNFDPGEFSNDLKRLKAAVDRSGRFIHGKAITIESLKKPHPESGIKNRPEAFIMINNLAREKFGVSSRSVSNSPKKSKESSQRKSAETSPKKSNLKRASLLQSPKIVPEGHTMVLDLADDELSHILASRFHGVSSDIVAEEHDTHPVSFVADFATQIVEELVGTVCQELFLDDVFEKILKLELRG